MEETMSHLSKLSAALAATSIVVLSASAAHATVNIPKPVINIPKPVINVPRPAVNVMVHKPAVTSTPISSSVKPSIFAGKPATVQNTVSSWQGPAGAGTQSTSLIYQNGKVVGAMSAIAKNPATTVPKPGTVPVASNNNPVKPGTVASHPPAAPAAVQQPASKPAAAAAPAPAAKPPAPAAKPKVTFTPVEYPAFTDQYGVVKGYYVNGKIVSCLAGPTGGSCSPTIGYQTPGGGGGISSTPRAGMVTVKAVMCYIKS
jgi:hypothetical protein